MRAAESRLVSDFVAFFDLKWMFLLALAGCATIEPAASKGSTVTEVRRETRLCLDQSFFREGAEVWFQRHVCHQHPKHFGQECRDVPSASGQVVRVIDDHCAVISLGPDADVRPGDELVWAPARASRP
jgi:hypothetical protein